MPRDPREFIKKVNSAFDLMDGERKAERRQLEEERKGLLTSLANNIAEIIRPLFEKHAEQTGMMKDVIRDALSELQLPTPSVQVSPPQVRVNVPEVKVPEIKIPPSQFPTLMKVLLQDIDVKNPLPVVLVDPQGMKYKAIGGGGVGARWVSGSRRERTIMQGAELGGNLRDVLVDEGGRMQVDVIAGGGGGTEFNEDVPHTSGDAGKLVLAVRTDTAIARAGTDGDYIPFITDGSGRLHVSPSGLAFNSGVTNDNTVRVVHVTDVATSVSVTSFTASVETHPATPSGQTIVDEEFNALQIVSAARGTELNAGVLRTMQVADVISSTNVTQWAGDALAKGTELSSGVLRVVQVSDIITSVSVKSADVSFEVKQVSGLADSVSVIGFTVTVNTVGSVASDVADDGDPPLKVGGIARTANPTAVGNGDRITSTYDSVGRQVIQLYQMRGLIATAYATVSTGVETTLITASAGEFYDCIMITFANQSSVAADVDIRSVSAGNVVASVTIPADSTVGWAPVVPYPQDNTGNAWTFDNTGADVSGTTINATGLFIRNV